MPDFAAVLREVDTSAGPGYVAAVGIAGRLVYEGACGMADLARRVANTPRTRMRIGSTSKEMTAFAVLCLAEEGRVGLDQPVRHYVPALPRYAQDPTVRQLLNHTAGVRCHVANAFLQDVGHAVREPGAALREICRQTTLCSKPGERWLYSNAGYHLLSAIASTVSGMPFPEFMRQRLFEPLGMHDTTVEPSDLSVQVPSLATLHLARADGRYRLGQFPFSDLLGEGGVVSTAADMLKWLRHLRQPRDEAGARAVAQMCAPTRLSDGTELPYGFGLLRLQRFGREIWMHAGAVMGGAAQACCVPGDGIEIAVMSNGAATAPGELAGRLLTQALGDSAPSAAPIEKAAAAGDYPALAGRSYLAPSGNAVRFVAESDTLGLSLFGNPAVPLKDVHGRLVLRFEDTALGPIVVHDAAALGGASTPARLHLSEGGLSEAYQLQEPERAGEFARDIVGRYACVDLATHATIEGDASGLRMTVHGDRGGFTATVKPQGQDLAIWEVQDEFMPLVGALSARRRAGRIAAFQVDTWTSRALAYRRVQG